MARSQNLVLGRGKLFVDMFDADGNSQGEFYIGNTTSLTVSQDEDKLEHFNSDEGLKEKDDEAVLSNSMTIEFTTDDIQPENLAMFFKGEEVLLTQAAVPSTVENITVKKLGRWYQIGVSPTHPQGVRAITKTSLTDDAGTPVAVAAGDYIFDGDLGRVYISEDAVGVEEGDILILTYATLASTRSVVLSQGDTARGSVRFISANPKGKDRDHFWPLTVLTPSGDYELKGDDWQQMTFSGEVLKKAGLERHYADGRAVTT